MTAAIGAIRKFFALLTGEAPGRPPRRVLTILDVLEPVGTRG